MCAEYNPRAPGAERESYRRWWLEESGLSPRELYEIAVGLGGDFPYVGRAGNKVVPT